MTTPEDKALEPPTHPDRMWCLKCRAHFVPDNPERQIASNNRPYIKARCPRCKQVNTKLMPIKKAA